MSILGRNNDIDLISLLSPSPIRAKLRVVHGTNILHITRTQNVPSNRFKIQAEFENGIEDEKFKYKKSISKMELMKMMLKHRV